VLFGVISLFCAIGLLEFKLQSGDWYREEIIRATRDVNRANALIADLSADLGKLDLECQKRFAELTKRVLALESSGDKTGIQSMFGGR